MPRIFYRDSSGQESVVECQPEVRLRTALLQAGLTPHNGKAQWVNCKGFGTCGTCAVEIAEPLAPKNARERWRLDFPPHQADQGLRLACQVRVTTDLHVKKHPGFWGQHLEKTPGEDAT